MQIQEIAERWGPSILAVQRAHNKDYSFASQETIMKNTAKYRGINKSRPTLCRDERKLEDEKYIKRIQRIKRDPNLGMVFKSTIIMLGMKMYHALARMGINVSKEIKNLLAKLRFKYPEFEAKVNKKKLGSAKKNPRHEESMRGIEEKLEKRHVIE